MRSHPSITGETGVPALEPIHANRPASRHVPRPRYGESRERLLAQFNSVDIPAAKPTNARPGTPEKIEILEQRCDAGLPFWHPDDSFDDARVEELCEATFEDDEP